MLPPSVYLPFFQANRERLAAESNLVGDILLIERIVFPEKKSAAGIILTDSRKVQSTGITSEVPQFFRVLLVGKGYYDDVSGKDVPCEAEQGDIVLTAQASVKLYSSLPVLQTTDSDVLGLTRYGDVQWHWKGETTFLRFLNDLNQAVSAGAKAPGGRV